MATNQPGAIDAATDLFVFTNRATTTLDGAISDSDLTIVVADGSVFPTTGRFIITIENERIIIASRSTETLTVEAGGRGIDNSTNVAHANLIGVAGQFTALNLETVRDAVIATQEGHVRYPDAHSASTGLSRHGNDPLENVRRWSL